MYEGKIVEVTLSKFIANQKHIARIVRGEVIRETEKAVLITNVKMVPKPHVNCVWCGTGLTNPVSRKLGVGPICIRKYGERMGWDADYIENLDKNFDKLTDREIKAILKQIAGETMTTEELWVPKRGGVTIVGEASKRTLALVRKTTLASVPQIAGAAFTF